MEMGKGRVALLTAGKLLMAQKHRQEEWAHQKFRPTGRRKAVLIANFLRFHLGAGEAGCAQEMDS